MSRTTTLLLLLLGPAASYADDWRQFRGPRGLGVSTETGLPVRWGATENVSWKVDLPGRGLSSPIIVDGRVYVTASSGAAQDRLHVLCFEATTGKQLWHRQFWATGSTICHPKTCTAAPTPVGDGECVFALFASGDLFCLDRNSLLRWCRSLAKDYPSFTNQIGLAASPVLHKDTLLLAME